ncbi:MAG: DUF4384 domain-containing protein, partial [Gammaproteobacteria bacterium]
MAHQTLPISTPVSARLIRIFSAILLICASNITSAKDDLREVTTVGKAVISGNTTYDQAKTQALNQARALAVEQAAGVTVSNTSIIQDGLMLVDLVNTFSHGFLVKETRKSWKGSWAEDNTADKLGFPIIEVALTGTVKVLPKTFFRNYNITANLNKKTFANGEKVQIRIKAKEDMYVVVANYTSKNNIIPIFPSPYHKNNLVKAGDTIIIPELDDSHFTLAVSNYAGHKEDVEAFLVFGFQRTSETSNMHWARIFKAGEELNYPDFFSTL